MPTELPELDWYLDHVVLPSRALVGMARSRQATWDARARELSAAADASTGAALEVALAQGFVLTLGQARAAGLSNPDVRRLVRRGAWGAPHRGVLSVLRPHTGSDRHVLTATAAALARPGHAISGPSAAVVHGLPLLRWPKRIVLTAAAPSRMGARGRVIVRAARLPGDAIANWHGAPVTTIAATIVDLARADRAAGVVAADAALHEQLVGLRELHRAAVGCAGWPGARAACAAIDLATPLAESPLESLTRLCIVDAGLPVPELQAWIDGPDWRYRVDTLWREPRVILEADGRLKYRADEL